MSMIISKNMEKDLHDFRFNKRRRNVFNQYLEKPLNLVLTVNNKPKELQDQYIKIGQDIFIKVHKKNSHQVAVTIKAPREIEIRRFDASPDFLFNHNIGKAINIPIPAKEEREENTAEQMMADVQRRTFEIKESEYQDCTWQNAKELTAIAVTDETNTAIAVKDLGQTADAVKEVSF